MINTVSQEVAWLHKDTTMFHVQKSMKQSQEKSTGIALRDGNELSVEDMNIADSYIVPAPLKATLDKKKLENNYCFISM